ncbi:amino acid adenylation domain-containing protein [Pseudoalteromonas luteoviolacea]|uniref:non-ribosomal peptide synthetase n=1 Tax=Pseudoalteromonas luteoviolacea TaxID=43657 RepID=UPI001B3A1338|nr:non-ribosomal peptide synthetase [Pseudoalteromonas luteoviolacea]MBQ4878622.1 amino acid adenylation domain-containing protein [Pseudoalteromonas luteoviolacea]MBQ4907162.1 amino acid adenylation domain-containing protein [Pseudoalteromonas luteoviolacea]
MSAEAIIKAAQDAGVYLYCEHNKLKYSAAKGHMSEELKQQIAAHKDSIILLLNRAAGFAVDAPSKQTSLDIATGESWPLSFSQQRIWLATAIYDTQTAYHMPVVMNTQGSFDVHAAQQAMQLVIDNHTILKTVYEQTALGVVQRVLPDAHFELEVYDVALRGELSEQAYIAELKQDFFAQQFDLTTNLMIRGAYIKVTPERGILMFSVHHIAADGWSIILLNRYFSEAYQACVSGQVAQLSPPQRQYKDYAFWQRHNLSEDVFEAQRRYWQKQLDNVAHSHQLPLDYPRPEQKQASGKEIDAKLSRETTQRLASIAQHYGITEFMLYQAILAVVIARHSNTEDIVIGTPLAKRELAQLDEMVGCFLNTVALRLNVSDCPVSEFFEQVKQVHLGAHENSDVPFEEVLGCCAIKPSKNITPLIQIMFNMDNVNTVQASEFSIGGLQFGSESTDQHSNKFDLTIRANPVNGQMKLSWIYDNSLFKEASVQRLNQSWMTLLTSLAGKAQLADCQLSQLTMLTEQDEAQIMAQSFGTTQSLASNLPVFRQFEEQAANRAAATAVVFEDKSLSYAQLDAQANQLARYLCAQGVSAEQPVAICMERSLELVVAMLAIQKAGAAYVPIDTQDPAERKQYILDSSEARWLVTQSELVASLPSSEHYQCLVVDDPEVLTLCAEYECTSLPYQCDDGLAYVIYTSGSTGQPKGVATGHRALSNRIDWMQRTYPLDAQDKVLQKTPYTFDVSIWEFFWPLSAGATLVLAKPQGHTDAHYLQQLISAQKVTTMHFVPSMLKLYLEACKDTFSGHVKRVFCSGEALEPAVLSAFQARASGTELHNLYGPTEAAIDVSYFDCRHYSDQGSVPIGRAIQNTQLLVLDKHLNLVPKNVPGELYIGGEGLAKGYINQNELTAERFIVHPFDTSQRLYRTGDLARYDEDGLLYFLGRIDSQVKLNGQRIEPGEIEYQLNQLATVRDAAIEVNSHSSGYDYLCAYVVPAQPIENNDDWCQALRAALGKTLPAALVPSKIMVLDALPLTNSGKLDRRALKQYEEGTVQLREHIAPRNPMEEFVAQLWLPLLGLTQLSVEDSFFELGGQSLIAMTLVNRLQEQLGEVIHLTALYEAPTVAALAAFLQQNYGSACARLGLIEAEEETVQDIGLGTTMPDDPVAAVADLLAHVAQPVATKEKKPRAVFILAPHRSGSTLLRVILAGHTELFAPPELELLNFATVAEREAAFSGRFSLYKEGVLQAIMELTGCSANEADDIMARLSADQASSVDLFAQLQTWSGRTLVDKSPGYAYDTQTLLNIEQSFSEVQYIHLVRHPAGMVSSFVEAKLDQVMHLKPHQYNARELSELLWCASHRNIEQFLATIPASRHTRVLFEQLVADPSAEVQRLCEFLGINYDPTMLDVYDDQGKRMTGGKDSGSRMLGDVKFHTHKHIDAEVGAHWQAQARALQLTPQTQMMAQQLGYQAQPHTVIPARDLNTPAPLSFAQSRIWLLDKVLNNKTAYNTMAVFELSGEISLPMAQRALSQIIQRHEVLRTTYLEHDGQVVQRVNDAPDFTLEEVDLSQQSQALVDSLVERLIEEEALKPFDLSSDIMLRARYLKLAPQRGIMLFNLHHIAADGWSLSILKNEFIHFYEACQAGSVGALAPLPVQYADYASWLHQSLGQKGLTSQLEYWQQQLQDPPVVHSLPLDFSRPAEQQHDGGWVEQRLTPAQVKQLEQYAQQQGMTLFMLFHALYSLTLSQFSHSHDIVVGTPVVNRNLKELEGVIGMFLNTLPLRVSTEHVNLADYLAHVKQVNVEAHKHQDIPFETLVSELQIERNSSYSPLFQVVLNFNTTMEDETNITGLDIRSYQPFDLPVKFDLQLVVEAGTSGFLLSWGYAKSLFSVETVTAFSNRLQEMLLVLCEQQDPTLAQLLAPSDLPQDLVTQSDKVSSPLSDIQMTQLFNELASQDGKAIAVVDEHDSRCFAQLERDSNQLAHCLLAQLDGCPSDTQPRVGVILERNYDMAVAVLACLKAGVTFLPLDADYPQQRIHRILNDAAVDLVLCHQTVANTLKLEAFNHLVLDSTGTQSLCASQLDTLPTVRRSDVVVEPVAYVIYTSGSTGTPKGVMVSEQNLLSFYSAFRAQISLFGELNQGSLWNSSLAFDASIKSILLLLMGNKLAISSSEQSKDPEALVALAKRENLALLNFAPALMELVLPQLQSQQYYPHLIVSGDQVGEPLWAQLQSYQCQHQRVVINAYGPTEATVNACFGVVDTQALPHIGKPQLHTTAFILDRQQRRLPAGAVGELCLAGKGLTLGYLNDPQKTAAAFISAPWDNNLRLYRSGDLARYNPDGTIQFIGRCDRQVKVRGYRIELDEIQATMQAFPQVGKAEVFLDTTTDSEARILAAFVANGECSAETLKQQVAAQLPEFMLPAQFIALQALPLSASGKVDFNAIKALANTESGDAGGLMPTTETEKVVARMWQHILQLDTDQIAVTSCFFDLGGHSLSAFKLVMEIKKTWGLNLPVRNFFKVNNIKRVAELIDTELQLKALQEQQSAVEITEKGTL